MPKVTVLFLVLVLVGVAQAAQTFNVLSFGAHGDGVTDDTKAVLAAWGAACRSPKATLLVSRGSTFLVAPLTFSGPCQPGMVLQMDGTIVAPGDPSTWPRESGDAWIRFEAVSQFSLQGGGVFDGRGQAWWQISCKKNKSPVCNLVAPTAVRFEGGRDIVIWGVTFRNSQQMNMVINNVQRARVTAVKVQNPEDSPNTDGIHVGASAYVNVDHCTIGTGDDCVSIGPGANNIVVDNVVCGPGHGISVGSLGKGNSVDYVSNILVQNSYLRGTTNGVRIKTWQGGRGRASKIRFENLRMIDVANPIIIDQYYCDSDKPCMPQNSNVEVSDVSFENIDGISATPVATKLDCSISNPCRNIRLSKINLKLPNGAQANAYCENALNGAGFLPTICEPR